MFEIEATRDDLYEMQRLVIRERTDWPLVFSANTHFEIWPFISNGYTRPELRELVRGIHPLLDEITQFYLFTRPGGGRFFVDLTGAYYKGDDSTLVRFVKFRLY